MYLKLVLYNKQKFNFSLKSIKILKKMIIKNKIKLNFNYKQQIFKRKMNK